MHRFSVAGDSRTSPLVQFLETTKKVCLKRKLIRKLLTQHIPHSLHQIVFWNFVMFVISPSSTTIIIFNSFFNRFPVSILSSNTYWWVSYFPRKIRSIWAFIVSIFSPTLTLHVILVAVFLYIHWVVWSIRGLKLSYYRDYNAEKDFLKDMAIYFCPKTTDWDCFSFSSSSSSSWAPLKEQPE